MEPRVEAGLRCPWVSADDRSFPLDVARTWHGATWMQTSGTALLAVERCRLVGVWLAAQDGRSAHGLLYLAAVRDDRRKQEHIKVTLTAGLLRSRLWRR